MALTKCKECGKEVSRAAEACPHCGIKNPVGSIRAETIIKAAITVVLILFGLTAINGWNNDGPQCVMSDLTFSKKLFGGYELSARLTNRGKAGTVYVLAGLESAEGDFYGMQTLTLKEKEVKVINYDFDQPYGSASDVKVRASCAPPFPVRKRDK